MTQEEMIVAISEACEHHDPEKLTDRQKVSLAVALGVPFKMRPSLEGNAAEIVTAPCVFSIDRYGEWEVAYREPLFTDRR